VIETFLRSARWEEGGGEEIEKSGGGGGENSRWALSEFIISLNESELSDFSNQLLAQQLRSPSTPVLETVLTYLSYFLLPSRKRKSSNDDRIFSSDERRQLSAFLELIISHAYQILIAGEGTAGDPTKEKISIVAKVVMEVFPFPFSSFPSFLLLLLLHSSFFRYQCVVA